MTPRSRTASLEGEVRMVRTEKEKMLAGELYTANSPEIQADQGEARAWMQRFNANIDVPLAERYQLLEDRFAGVGAVRPQKSERRERPMPDSTMTLHAPC